jgi:hypothetical protein
MNEMTGSIPVTGGRDQRVIHERNQRSGYRQGSALSAARGPFGARPNRRCRLRTAELQSRPLEGGAGGGTQEACNHSHSRRAGTGHHAGRTRRTCGSSRPRFRVRWCGTCRTDGRTPRPYGD